MVSESAIAWTRGFFLPEFLLIHWLCRGHPRRCDLRDPVHCHRYRWTIEQIPRPLDRTSIVGFDFNSVHDPIAGHANSLGSVGIWKRRLVGS